MRLLVLGIAGLGLSADDIQTILCVDTTKTFEANFMSLVETGAKVDSLLNSLKLKDSSLNNYLSEYGKNEEITRILDNTLPAMDPVQATENIIDSLGRYDKNAVNVDNVDNAVKLINDLVARAKDHKVREDILNSMVIVIERADIKPNDPRMELARKVLLNSPEGQRLLLLRHIGLLRDAIIADIQVFSYFSASKSTMKRIENELSTILTAGLSAESARILLATLKEQTAQNVLRLSEKISQKLIDAFQKLDLPELKQLMGYMDNIISNQLADVSFGLADSAMKSMLTHSSLHLALSLMNIQENIAKNELEAARCQAEAAAKLADAQSLRASLVRYLPGFIAASLNGRLSEKNLEEISIAIRTDKSQGLFVALDMVQGILRDEFLTDLENLFRKFSIFELPPKLAILGNVLRMEKLINRKNRFRLAIEIVEKMEKSSVWLKALDLIATQQYSRLTQLIEKWVEQNYLNN